MIGETKRNRHDEITAKYYMQGRCPLSFLDDQLMEGETIKYRTRLHWFYFFGPVFWICVGLLLLGGSDVARPIGGIIGVASFIWLLGRIVVFVTSEFGVSDKRVIFKVGFIQRNSLEILLSKVEMISVNQSITGRILGFGTIVVGGSGGSKNKFPMITAPMELRLNVQQQVDIVQG
jgi:uncharacterized membrane protein YdbT with pleckstrin-like domain